MNLNFDIRFIVVAFLSLLISIVVHEFAHAWVAYRLGDDTAQRQGFMTLNPMAQIQRHTYGAFLLPLLGPIFGVLIGWGSVPVDASRVNRKYSIRNAEFMIAIAGPVANILLALVSVGLYAIAVRVIEPSPDINPIIHITVMLVQVNLFLAAFNLMPIAPLDGYTVLRSKAPDSWRPAVEFIEQNGPMLFIVVLLVGSRLFRPLAELGWFLLSVVR
jgi:Zn-dependent protease